MQISYLRGKAEHLHKLADYHTAQSIACESDALEVEEYIDRLERRRLLDTDILKKVLAGLL